MNRLPALVAPALLSLAVPALAQGEAARPFDMSPETPALAAAVAPKAARGAGPAAPAQRRHILPSARLRMEGENASRSWQVWLTPAEAAQVAAKVQIAYRSAILVAPETSRLRLSINGVTLADDPVKAPEHLAELSAVIPAGVLKPGPNVFTLETEQRHRTDCTPESTYELWTEFDAGRSFLSFADPGATRLSALEDIRAVGVGPGGATRVAILAPDLADPAVEAQVVGIAQALAIATAMPNTAFSVSSTADDAFRAAELKVALDASLVGGTGAGAFVQSPDYGSVLALDGSAAEMARIAALARPQDPAAPVVDTASWRLPDAPLVTQAARLTFADLGAPTREFAGRRASVEFQVALPADFYASAYGEARLLLDAAYSAEVLPGSRIDVLVNGQLASTLPITSGGGAILRHLPIDVTMRHLRPGPNLIRIEAVTRTAADAVCAPGAAPEAKPRFALFGASEFVMPAFARIARRPDLAATAGRGYPFAGAKAPTTLVLTGDRPAALSAAATVLGKIAQSAGAPAPFRIAAAAGAGDALVVGPAPAIGPETFALLGVDPARLIDWKAPAPDAGAAPAEPSLDAWRGAVDRGAWLRPIEAVARGFGEDADALGAALGGSAAFAPGPGTGFLLAQGVNAAGDGSLTLVTAPTPALLASGAADAAQEALWSQIAGRATAFDAGSGAVTVALAAAPELVRTQPWSLRNLRLIGANWMSSNALIFAGALASACILLGLATTGLLSKLGRRG